MSKIIIKYADVLAMWQKGFTQGEIINSFGMTYETYINSDWQEDDNQIEKLIQEMRLI